MQSIFLNSSTLRLHKDLNSAVPQLGDYNRIRNGLYLHHSFRMESEADRYVIANHLYEPSYVSLFGALHYYSLIPEHVYETTSVTTRKTTRFEFSDRRFSFRTIKPALFFGYEAIPWKDQTYLIARPEKAILDLAYLEPQFSDPDWLLSLRFDEWALREDIDWFRMHYYAMAMGTKTVLDRIKLLINTYEL